MAFLLAGTWVLYVSEPLCEWGGPQPEPSAACRIMSLLWSPTRRASISQHNYFPPLDLLGLLCTSRVRCSELV